MASVFLDSNDTFTVSNNNVKVYGGNGSEVVTIATGLTGVTFDQSVERVALPGAFSSYTYQQQGINLLAYNSSNVLVATIPVLSGVTAITTTSGTSTVAIAAGGVMTLGNSTVTAGTTAAQATAVAPITINNALVTPGGSTTTPISGSTFTLTAGFDNLTGTTGDDTFNGIAGQTLSAGDAIAGGAGSDNLNILVTTATGSPEVFDATGLETISVRNLSGGSQTVSAANWLGYTTLVNDRSTTSSTVALSSVASNIALVLNKSASNTTVSYNTDVFKGSSDAVTVTATDATAGTLTLTSAASAEKVETINLASNGTANVITDIVATNGASKLVVSGSANLTLSNDVAIPTVDASTATGKISLVATGTYAATNPSSVDVTDLTITTGTGNDTIDVSGVVAASEISVNAGAGDDKVVIAATGSIAYDAATSTVAADVINGADGNDTLSVNGNLTADLTGVVSGFEILDFSASASGTAITTTKLDISKFSSTGDAVDVVLTGLANNSTFTINGDGSDLDASIATDSSADALNVVLAGTGTTTGAALIAQNYETLNITSNSDSDLNTNKIASVSSSSYVSKVTLSGSTNLAGGTITVKSAATFDASAYTGDLTATEFGASVKSYIGGTGKDEITLYAGDLKQGNTFAGGAGTDKLTVTAGASQNAGILAVTGFETISITGNDSSADTVTADFRNVTGLTTLLLNSGSGDGDSFIINRLITGVNVQVDSALAALTIGNESGAVQNVKLGAAVTTLTVDAAASTLNISNVYNGNNALTTLVGASLTNIIVTEKLATTGILDLGSALSSVTSIDASALITSQVTGALGAAGTATGGKLGDNLTGSAGKDTITGNQGNDTINGGNGTDTIVFGTETTNGADALTIKAGAINTGTVANDGDILKFAAFLPNGSVDQNGGTGNTITAYTTSSVGDTNITNKVALITGTEADVDETSEIALLIEGSGDAFSITTGGKAVVISGVASATSGGSNEQGRIFFVNDANGDGSITTAEVTLVGTTAVDFSIGGFVSTNFAFA